jgi:hypothetical protein
VKVPCDFLIAQENNTHNAKKEVASFMVFDCT